MNVKSINVSLHSLLLIPLFPSLCVHQEFVQFFKETLDRKVCWGDRLEFINGWYILLIISDVLTIIGSIIKIGIESKACPAYQHTISASFYLSHCRVNHQHRDCHAVCSLYVFFSPDRICPRMTCVASCWEPPHSWCGLE